MAAASRSGPQAGAAAACSGNVFYGWFVIQVASQQPRLLYLETGGGGGESKQEEQPVEERPRYPGDAAEVLVGRPAAGSRLSLCGSNRFF